MAKSSLKVFLLYFWMVSLQNSLLFHKEFQVYRRLKEPPERSLKAQLVPLDLVRFAVSRDEIARRIKEFTLEDRAKSYFDEEATPISQIEYRVAWGRAKLDEGKITEAVEYFDEAIELIQRRLYPKDKVYYVTELLAKSFEGRGLCRIIQQDIIQANKDYLSAIKTYIQLEQFEKAFQLYQEIAEVNLEILKTSHNREQIKSVAELFQLSIPVLENLSEKISLEDGLLIPRIRFHAGLAYRKIGMFTLAGLQFKTVYEETKGIQPNLAFVLALEAGECFIKAEEFGRAYNIYMEAKNLLTTPDLRPIDLIPEETLRKNIVLLRKWLVFLKERFPWKEAKFIRYLQKLIEELTTSPVH